MQKGITKEIIFKESERMVKLYGVDNFSVRALSNSLQIKPASLYNHIEGIDEIYNHLTKKASDMMIKRLRKAMNGKPRDEALLEGARAYCRFAETNREYYLLLIKSKLSKNKTIARLGFSCFDPIIELIKSYGLPKKKTINFLRTFRAFLHGFIEISHNGFMRLQDVSKEETFDTAVSMYIKCLNEEAAKCGGT